MEFDNFDYNDEVIRYDQYNNTNLQRLLYGRADIKNKVVRAAFLSLIDNVFHLETSQGDALDIWGYILGFPRFVSVQDPLSLLSLNDENFTDLVLLDNNTKQGRLKDDAYRTVLLLLSQTQNVSPAITIISPMLSQVLKARVTISDGLDMRFITYYFRDEMPAWLECVINSYDVLPRPAGMSTKYLSAIYRYIHFKTNDPEWNKNIASFWKTRFYDKESPQSYVTSNKVFPIIEYPLDSVTQNIIRGERDERARYLRNVLKWNTSQVDKENARYVLSQEALKNPWDTNLVDRLYNEFAQYNIDNIYPETEIVVTNKYNAFRTALQKRHNLYNDEYAKVEHPPLADHIDKLIEDSNLYLNPKDNFYYIKNNENDDFDTNNITPFVNFQGVNYKYSEGISTHKKCAPTAVIVRQSSQVVRGHKAGYRRVEIEYCLKDEDNPAIKFYKDEVASLIAAGDILASEASKLEPLYEGFAFYKWVAHYIERNLYYNYIDYRIASFHKGHLESMVWHWNELRKHETKFQYITSPALDELIKSLQHQEEYVNKFLANQKGRQTLYITNLYTRLQGWIDNIVPHTLESMTLSDEVRKRLKERFAPMNTQVIKSNARSKLDKESFDKLQAWGSFKTYITNLDNERKDNISVVHKLEGFQKKIDTIIAWVDRVRKFPSRQDFIEMGFNEGEYWAYKNRYDDIKRRGGNYNDDLMLHLRLARNDIYGHEINVRKNNAAVMDDRYDSLHGKAFEKYGFMKYEPDILP